MPKPDTRFPLTVRGTLLGRVAEHIEAGHSVKLTGMFRTGVSTFLKSLELDTSLKSRMLFVLFNGPYAAVKFRERLAAFCVLNELPKPRLSGDDLCGLVLTVRDRLAAKLKGKQLVLIFDEFDRNFATVANRQDSILTIDNLTSLHHFSEQEQRVQFVVTYTHPVDLILNEDWYLRNFVREDVDLLSESEAREMVGSSPKSVIAVKAV